MENLRISMSKKELKKLNIIKRSLRKGITVKKAAELLNLSKRQIYNLRRNFKKEGAEGLIHGNRGCSSNRRMPKKEKKKITRLLHKHYPDFGPTLASEKLEEKHEIKRDPKTIRKIMIKENLWKPKRRKKTKWRSKRARKPHFGEMVQFDGSYHRWFEKRASKCCLLAAIDDATSIVTHAQFVESEGTMPVFFFWSQYLLLRGKPVSIYLDRLRTYTNNGVTEGERKGMLTQFERGMKELGIKTISSHSCQARGRVERLFHTFQDRVIKEMRLKNVSSKKEGNSFLKNYLPSFNKKFGKEPRKKDNLHQELSKKEKKALLAVFSRQSKRIVKNDFTISFKNVCYQLTEEQPATIRPKDKVIVEERFNGSLKIRLRGKYLNYKVLSGQPARLKKHSWIIAASQEVSEEYPSLKVG